MYLGFVQRRQATKERMARLGIQPDGGASGSDSEEAGNGEEQDDVKIYHSGQLTSTVTVTAIHNSDRYPRRWALNCTCKAHAARSCRTAKSKCCLGEAFCVWPAGGTYTAQPR